MKRTILFLAIILTTSFAFGQNNFPPTGNASIGTTASSALLNVGGNVVLSSAANRKIEANGTLTGGTSAIGILNQSIIQSDVLSTYYNKTLSSTQAASFTLSSLIHYGATQGTIGAGSSITTQSGFWAESTMVGAGTNYGFRGSIPIGTGTANWNTYMGGTAPNYFNGDVLIGTTTNSLSTKLYVEGNGTFKTPTGGGTALNLVQTTSGSKDSPTNNKIVWMTKIFAESASIDVPDSKINIHGVPMVFTTRDNTGTLTEKMRIANGGNVGIGTTTPGSKLTVNGTIHATEVKVTSTVPAPDYVFEKYYLGKSSLKPDYRMLTLSEVEKFTEENHHLPNVPSAKEIKENGLHLGEMSNIMLQKIEELTLYSIEQQKTIEKQATSIEKLEKENAAFKKLEERLARLEKDVEAKK